jgi:hypothetical protein
MTTATRRYASHVQAGEVLRSGQVVYLAGAASPQFAAPPIRLRLTEDAAPSAIDAAAGRDAVKAEWLHLAGWELDRQGRNLSERFAVRAFVGGIVIINGSNGAR